MSCGAGQNTWPICYTLPMEIIDAVFVIAIIMFSAVIHGVMHGVAADWLGDPAARLQGRLTLNPIPHIDMVGSILLPVVLALSQSPFLFGWAKPVPYNPYNLRPGRFSEAIVAAAGPLSNLAIALVFSAVLRFAPISEVLFAVIFLIVLVNVMLFLFNLIPIPPLDGSKILASILPGPLSGAYDQLRARLEYNPFLGFGLVLLIVIVFGSQFGAYVYALAQALAGI